MKTKNKTLTYLFAFVPLLILETVILAFEYYEPGNMTVNINLSLIFGVVALMIIAGKFFFDFIVTLIVNKSTKSTLGAGDTLHTLASLMPIQWVMLLPVVALMFFVEAPFVTLLFIAVANVAYYAFAAFKLYKITGKKAYIIMCIAMISVTMVSTFMTF